MVLSMHIATYVTDLFFLVRIKDMAQRRGAAVMMLPRQEEAVERLQELRPQWLLVDLAQEPEAWVPLVRAAKAVGAKVLAFGPHRDLHRRRLAEEAGADLVVSNARFSQELLRLLQGGTEEQGQGKPEGRIVFAPQRGGGGDDATR